MQVFYVLLGWLLALFTPRFVRLIQRPYQKSEIQRSLFLEFSEFRHKLSLLAYRTRERSATINQEFLGWLKPLLVCYGGPNTEKELPEVIEKLSSFPDEELMYVSQQAPGRGIGLKTYSLPFIDAQLPSLSMFPVEFQRRVLDVRTRTNELNQEIEYAWFSLKKSFDMSLDENSRNTVAKNLEEAYNNIGRQSQMLADRITDIISEFPAKGLESEEFRQSNQGSNDDD